MKVLHNKLNLTAKVNFTSRYVNCTICNLYNYSVNETSY